MGSCRLRHCLALPPSTLTIGPLNKLTSGLAVGTPRRTGSVRLRHSSDTACYGRSRTPWPSRLLIRARLVLVDGLVRCCGPRGNALRPARPWADGMDGGAEALSFGVLREGLEVRLATPLRIVEHRPAVEAGVESGGYEPWPVPHPAFHLGHDGCDQSSLLGRVHLELDHLRKRVVFGDLRHCAAPF